MRISDWSSDVCSSDLEPRAFQNAARGGVDAFAWRARLHGVERRGLRFFFQIPHIPDFDIDGAKGIGACDVAVIAVDRAARIEQAELPLLQRLILGQSGGKGGCTPGMNGPKTRSAAAKDADGPWTGQGAWGEEGG